MKTLYLAIAAVLIIAGCERREAADDGPQASARTWEYKQTTSFAKNFPEEELNRVGADGWELVHVHRERDSGYYTLYTFKRPKVAGK